MSNNLETAERSEMARKKHRYLQQDTSQRRTYIIFALKLEDRVNIAIALGELGCEVISVKDAQSVVKAVCGKEVYQPAIVIGPQQNGNLLELKQDLHAAGINTRDVPVYLWNSSTNTLVVK